ncbi:glycosyltransferase family 4 protein [Rhizobium sp. LjRoot254]|uniref:glycosyltransferase family 4 protein n=1 Tax=Rhizobium sp. LjRoot254 TaxID=3342297 RepID=UPI003ED0319D
MKPIDHESLKTGAEAVARPLIVHVVRQFLPNRGGLEDVVFNLCMQSIGHGLRVRVVTLNSLFSDPTLPLADREIIDGIEVVRMPWRGSSRYPVAPSVLAHIGDADIVHVHAIDFFYDFLALTRLIHRKPMIVTTHGGFFHTKKFAAIKNVWFQTLTRFSASQYVDVVGCSKSDRETFMKIAPSRTQLIENGTDTSKFANASSTSPRKRIVTLGRFSINKRLERLIATMAVLCAADPDWHLDILGVPSDLSVFDLEMIIADHGLSGNVFVRAGLDNASIHSAMSKSSFFASASEYEGFGLVAIETMSAGLVPILEANTAYTVLAARHSDIRLCDFTDAKGAADAIRAAYQSLLDDPVLRDRLMAEIETYSWAGAAASYFALYAGILEGARR